METPEEHVCLGSKEPTHIIKGKRTKRVRPQSPIPFITVTANSSNGEGDRGDNNNFLINDDDDEDDAINNNNTATTTTTCSAELQGSTEEEEDMANCLILLAQGQSWVSPKPVEDDDDDYDVNHDHNHNPNPNNGLFNYSKYSSRKFMEAATIGYECKTCNRTFPSFQALGGHRASHKKPKALASYDEEFRFKNKTHQFSLQLNNNNNIRAGNHHLYNKNKSSKVHECSVCGAEFTSGQALGGHMRRHRAPINGTTNTTLSLTPMALEPEEDHQPKKKRKLLSLELDLNLPAPQDDQRESNSNFTFVSKKQQQSQQQQSNVVFSAPSLVDCHY